jgi:peroxiredoxin Q/BCP
MAQLREHYPLFVESNTEVIAVGPEEPGEFKTWWQANQMPFIGIADPKHKIADLFGQKVNVLKLGRMPASFLVDKTGLIRFSYFGSSMSDIPESKKVLDLINHLNEEVK